MTTHVDEFIDDYRRDSRPEKYARWVLNHFRLPATLQNAFDYFMEDHKLFCNYENMRYRVTGASRMGDIWLTDDFGQSTGYKLRVDIEKCSDWDSVPYRLLALPAETN